jgi:hypothetical protein
MSVGLESSCQNWIQDKLVNPLAAYVYHSGFVAVHHWVLFRELTIAGVQRADQYWSERLEI